MKAHSTQRCFREQPGLLRHGLSMRHAHFFIWHLFPGASRFAAKSSPIDLRQIPPVRSPSPAPAAPPLNPSPPATANAPTAASKSPSPSKTAPAEPAITPSAASPAKNAPNAALPLSRPQRTRNYSHGRKPTTNKNECAWILNRTLDRLTESRHLSHDWIFR